MTDLEHEVISCTTKVSIIHDDEDTEFYVNIQHVETLDNGIEDVRREGTIITASTEHEAKRLAYIVKDGINYATKYAKIEAKLEMMEEYKKEYLRAEKLMRSQGDEQTAIFMRNRAEMFHEDAEKLRREVYGNL